MFWLEQGSLAAVRRSGATGSCVASAGQDGAGADCIRAWAGFLDEIAVAERGIVLADPAKIAWLPDGGELRDLPLSQPVRAVTTDSTHLYALTSAGGVHRLLLP